MNNLNKLMNNLFKTNPIRHLQSVRLLSDTVKNDEVKVSNKYVNRNPRNLEWSGHQYKRFGWNLQYPPKDFYHHCVFIKRQSSLEAYIEHQSGIKVLSVSTNEPTLSQHLFSLKDSNAAICLAKVLAHKCIRAGITNFHFLKSDSYEDSKREQSFYKALSEIKEISLTEPEFKDFTNEIPGLDYEDVDFHSKQRRIPFPPEVNRLKRISIEKSLKK